MNVIQECVSVVETAQSKVLSLLAASDYTFRQQEFKRFFREMLVRLEFMGATLGDSGEKKDLFPPVTNFMGEEIIENEKVDFKNTPEAKDVYLKQRNDLYDSILSFTPAQVLNSYRLPEHQTVVRGVAKKAGVPNYSERAMDSSFISDIQKAITSNNETAAQQGAIDEALKGESSGEGADDVDDPLISDDEKAKAQEEQSNDASKNETAAQQGATTPALLTAEDIKADPELQKLKARPGMEVFDNNGKKAVRYPKK